MKRLTPNSKLLLSALGLAVLANKKPALRADSLMNKRAVTVAPDLPENSLADLGKENQKFASYEANFGGLNLRRLFSQFLTVNKRLLGFWFVEQPHPKHNYKYYACDYVDERFIHKLLFSAHRHNKDYGGYGADNNISPKNIHNFLSYFARLMPKIIQPIPVTAPPIKMVMVMGSPAGIKNPTTVEARRIFDKSEKYSASRSVWSLLNRICSIYQC